MCVCTVCIADYSSHLESLSFTCGHIWGIPCKDKSLILLFRICKTTTSKKCLLRNSVFTLTAGGPETCNQGVTRLGGLYIKIRVHNCWVLTLHSVQAAQTLQLNAQAEVLRLLNGSFRKLGVPYFGVLIIRILLFRVLYWGPLFSETPHSPKPQI